MKLLTFLVFLLIASASAVQSISPQNTKILLDNNLAVIIDVRESKETSYGIVPGAILLPMSTINSNYTQFKKTIDHIKKDKIVITYCASGVRAQQVGREIKKYGYSVLSLGSINYWVDAGYPVGIIK